MEIEEKNKKLKNLKAKKQATWIVSFKKIGNQFEYWQLQCNQKGFI
jgi:hypothetical protein